MGDVRNDELILKDLGLKGDLINVFDSLHDTFLGSIARLTDYQNSHAFLLLEFEFSLKSDSQRNYECIQSRPFCYTRHGIFYCAQHCYLT